MAFQDSRRLTKAGRYAEVLSALLAVPLMLSLGAALLLAQGTSQPGSGSAPPNPATDGERSREDAASVRAIGQSQLVGLPLNGRSYSQLATLHAGVSGASAGAGARGIGGGSLNIVGARATSNNFLLDGTNIMNTDNQVPRSAAGVQLGSDTVLQVQVFSAGYGADYGRGSGGVLNSITRSGSNEFHGTLFEYFRNSKLDARDFFDPSEPPPFKRNQFGFVLTGPVRKERTFFMGSFEAMRDRQASTDTSYLPDRDSRTGIIRNSDGSIEKVVTVNPAVKPYLALFPIANSVQLGGGIGENFGPQFFPTDEDFLTVRLDHQLSERDGLFLRYTFDDAASQVPTATYLFLTLNNTRQQYLTLTTSHIFSLSVIDSFRLGYTRPVRSAESILVEPIPTSLFFVPGAPQFGQISIPGLSVFGPSPTTPNSDIMNSFQFANDMVVTKRDHALKFGLDLHRYRWDVYSSQNQGATWSFNSLENFLLGGPEGTSLTVALPESDNRKAFRQTVTGLYLQDEVQVASRLQFNLGLRYEFATIIKDRYGRTQFMPDPARDPAVQTGPLFSRNPSLPGLSPRLGVTWSPGSGGNTVLGAGFGIYYDQFLDYTVQHLQNSVPFYRIAVRTNFDSSSTFPWALDAARGAGSYRFAARVADSDMQNPVVLRYNFALQQQFPGGWRAQATYVGARGNHLPRTYEVNQFPQPVVRADGSLFFPPNAGPINPAFSEIHILASDAQSFYNSLQVSANKNLSRGLSLQANYTFSKSIDDVSSHSSGTGQFGRLRTQNRGPSDFDTRHRLAVNYFYSVPQGRGQSWWNSGLLAQMFGGWRVGGILSFRTGVQFHPTANVRTPGYLFATDRPNLLPGRSNNPIKGVSEGCETLEAGAKLGTREQYFDPCVFGVPAPGTMGNTGRNTITGPGQFTTDVSLQKDFSLDSKRRLQFRAELFNMTNHANFNRPAGGGGVAFLPATIQDPVTGENRRVIRRNSFTGRIAETSTNPRQIQFALRLSF
ncbi:MAG: TonB-dependent receptor [Acidobacteria bacterium]|nr:TonB-dependent receptor [Acidobacteriota bacterium]